jgi:hypothetical protein
MNEASHVQSHIPRDDVRDARCQAIDESNRADRYSGHIEILRELIRRLLTAASYGIITGAGYTVTTVIARRHIFVVFQNGSTGSVKT